MKTKMLLSFIITHPEARSGFDDFFGYDHPRWDYWNAVGEVFYQMVDQMDDHQLQARMEEIGTERGAIYQASSDEPDLTVLEEAGSAFAALLKERCLGDDVDVHLEYV